MKTLDPIRALNAFDHQVQAQELDLLAIQLEDIVNNIAGNTTLLRTYAIAYTLASANYVMYTPHTV